MIFQFENYKVISDERQFIVQEERVIKEGRLTKAANIGKKYWEDIAYCREFESAIRTISRQILLDNDDLLEIRKKLDLLNDSILKLVNTLSFREDNLK